MESPTKKNIYESVSNFVSRKPEMFATREIFQALHQHLLCGNEDGAVLKCLSMIINCDTGRALAEDFDVISTLSSKLLNEPKNEEVLIHTIIALKNCMLSFKAFENPLVPWQTIVKLLIDKSYTKRSKMLQQSSIQTLRIMSDKADVKKELRKVYKLKIRHIPCLSDESEKLKDDLVEWLNYQNFKPDESPKYSKLLI